MVSPLRDVRHAVRLLWKEKAFSLATVLTLAVCIAANTTLFSIVYSVLLKPLAVPDADRLVLLYNSYPGAGVARASSGVPDYFDRLSGVPAIESLALFGTRSRSTGESGRPERILTMDVTPSYFRVARANAELGRTFAEDEGEVGRAETVVLSDGYWRERFGGDRGVVGRQLQLDGRSFTVIGVMPASFRFVDANVKLWTALAFTPEQRSDNARHSNNWTSIGRLRSGAALEQAQAQVDAINAVQLERFPAFKPLLVNAGFHSVVAPLQDEIVREVKGTLYLLWGGTVFVLLIGCVNVVNLALVRAKTRVRDVALRLALGASRVRVARQLLTESVFLSVVSGVLGIGIAWVALRLLGTMNLDTIPRGDEIRLDVVAVGFTLGVAAMLGLVTGAFPLVSALGVDLLTIVQDGGRTGSSGRASRLVRRTLVAAQVAVVYVLLLGAGLLMASFRQVLAVDPGFDARQVLTATVSLPESRYDTDGALQAFTSEALRRLRALPGVTQAGATSSIPFGGRYTDSVILAEGSRMAPGESVVSPSRFTVTPGYFEALRIRLTRGRLFDRRDTREAARVVIVDERLAHRFWPGRDPVGRRMFRPNNPGDFMATDERTEWLTVIGVVGNVRHQALVESQEPVGAYYFPVDQAAIRTVTFAVRSGADVSSLAGSLRTVIGAMDPELPVYETKTMEALTDELLVTRRWPVILATAFSVVALLLSAVGIYGVLAYLVTLRTKEIGIRMALGGSPRSIFDLVMKEGCVLAGVGIICGGAGLAALRQSLEAQLYQVQPGDPFVVGVATATLAAVALVACLVPARRATRIAPMIALSRD